MEPAARRLSPRLERELMMLTTEGVTSSAISVNARLSWFTAGGGDGTVRRVHRRDRAGGALLVGRRRHCQQKRTAQALHTGRRNIRARMKRQRTDQGRPDRDQGQGQQDSFHGTFLKS